MTAKHRSFQKESSFHHFVHTELNKIGMFFKKEALSIRGLPDEIGVANGFFCALEVKISRLEAQKKTGRIVLQKHRLSQFRKEGGYSRLVFPENWNEVYLELCSHCNIQPKKESLL